MPSAPPVGQIAPLDGVLPATATATLGCRPFGLYVHVPFCASRCGYCDFNTYTATELGGGAAAARYADTVTAELRFARRILGDIDLPVATVFVGGGTPTLLPAADLARVLAAIDTEFGLAADAEITTEANPDSVDAGYLTQLRAAGFTRLSLGMQSARPHVLAALDRTHTPGRAQQCVCWARGAGFQSVSLDLIYGTPGESAADWQASLDAAVATGADHLSAYALIVEDDTRLAGRVRRGELPAPDDDVLADRYLQADETLAVAGFGWYEVSNWARTPAARCRHNLGYWGSADWWGAGPGAHSHVGGVRWWNVRHPTAYAARIAAGASPAAGRELLDAPLQALERVLLGIRLAEGHPLTDLSDAGRRAASTALANGLLEAAAYAVGRAVLTQRGRLLADAVVRELID